VDSLPCRDDVTILIPVLNEAEAIGDVIDEVISVGIPRENILVVDGGSTDGTVKIVKSKGVKIIKQQGEGKADAIKSAIPHIKTGLVLVMDGDYTYPAKHIKDLCQAKNKGVDEVIGRRVVNDRTQGVLYRLGNWILTKSFNLLFGIRLKDVLSGMYLLDRETLENMEFKSKGFGVESEIAAHIAGTGGEIVEVPIEYRERKGEKKLRVKHGIDIMSQMIRFATMYNPVFLVFTLGGLLLIPGLLLGFWVAYEYYLHGTKYYLKGLVAVILAATGFQSLVVALLSLYLKRTEIRILRSIRRIKNESSRNPSH
jgi:glycosyltransferase involved in cell wall biosynthesis